MISVNSISGGKTSAFMAANYPADYNTFCLVRTEDTNCKFKDEKTRLLIEDKLQSEFIGTLEDDKIIYTILDLEQYIGKEIVWLSGMTYDDVVRKGGGWLPNKLHRYCTQYLKIEPQVQWWHKNFNGEPVEMRIGFRANEVHRAERMIQKLNAENLMPYKTTFKKHPNGKNKWEIVHWQKPSFPLILNNVYKDEIVKYWENKNVRFADYNNCVGCFHRNPLFLNKMWQLHPDKLEWFNKMEKLPKKGKWRSDTTYEKIKNYHPRFEINFEDFGSCDTQGCTD